VFTGSSHTDANHIAEFRNRWEYVSGDFGRPNYMTFANNRGRYFNDGPTKLWLPEGAENTDYILVSDHNRTSDAFTPERIGARKRMINGTMRSYHVTDKISQSTSWEDLPSRAYSTLEGYPEWALYEATKHTVSPSDPVVKFTVDGGAGGLELLKWHQQHHGSFWVFFSFDGVPVRMNSTTVFQGYSRVYEMVITEFDYETTRRSPGFQCGSDMLYVDLWNVSMTLEEV
jgi:hypothetical protein